MGRARPGSRPAPEVPVRTLLVLACSGLVATGCAMAPDRTWKYVGPTKVKQLKHARISAAPAPPARDDPSLPGLRVARPGASSPDQG